MKKLTNVAIYIRVSTLRQAGEGFSLDAQTEHLTNYCKVNNYSIYKLYCDAGKSGKNTNRPQLQEMFNDMRNNKFNKILVMKLDRISRSVIDLELMINEMKKYNCEFESATEKLDTDSAMGMMFIRLLGIFAAFERDRKAERINETFAYMVEQGQAISGSQPLGYKVKEIDGVKRVVKDEEKEPMVNDMFDYFFKTYSAMGTYTYLNNKYRYATGFSNFRKVFNNEIYTGKYKNCENYCDPYITKKQFEDIQNYFSSKPRITYTKQTYIFSGLVYCARCGHRLCGELKKTTYKNVCEYKTYRCTNKHINKKCDNGHIIFESSLEKYLLKNIIPQAEKTLLELNVNPNDKTIDTTDLEQEQERLNYMFRKNKISIEEYDLECEKLEKKINSLKSNKQDVCVSNLLNLKEINLIEYYNKLSDESKTAFWRKYVKKILFEDSKHISIIFN